MNSAALLSAIKDIIRRETGFAEHNPRAQSSSEDKFPASTPNTSVFRVVLLGLGREQQSPDIRFADMVLVLVTPLSGGDSNRSNEDAGTLAETAFDALESITASDYSIRAEMEAQILRDNARMIVTVSFRADYQIE